MMRTTWITVGLTVAACSSSSTNSPPTREEYDDTAQAIATASVTGSGGGDLGSMADSITIALGTLPLGFTLDADGHVSGSRLGIDYSYQVTCKNAAGTTLAVCDATTDRATVDVAWSGQLNTPNLDAGVQRTGTWTLTGLQVDPVTLDGDSTFSLDTTLRSIFRAGVTATYMFDSSASYHAVELSRVDHRAIGGSATFDISGHHTVTGSGSDVNASFDVHAVLTFHANGTAELVLDGNQNYSLDLSSGVVVRTN